MKWGLKYYLLVDCMYYCSWFSLYKGKSENEDAEKIEKAKTRTLCNEALATLPASMGAYKVYVDNYYGSLDLAYDTDDRGFYFTFNCRSNRPTFLFSNGLHKEYQPHNGIDSFACKVHNERPMAAVSWEDKKKVNYLTNQFSTEVTNVMQRQHGEDVKSQRVVPKVNQDYSETGMGHVDTYDAALSRFPHTRNTSWRRTHFTSMLKMSLVNAYVLYSTVLYQRGKKEGGSTPNEGLPCARPR